MASSAAPDHKPHKPARPAAASVRFDVFCRFLENLSRTKKKQDKMETVWGFLRGYSGGDMWPVFRLLWPESDRHRGNYHMREVKLGKLTVQVLGWSHGTRLIITDRADHHLTDFHRFFEMRHHMYHHKHNVSYTDKNALYHTQICRTTDEM